MAWRAAAKPKSSPPKSIAVRPAVPNAVSGAPSAFTRATWTFPPSGPEKPASTSLPFGSTITAWARLSAPHLYLRFPSPENVVSSEPLAFRRATATSRSASPTRTILPSGWSAAPKAISSSSPKSTFFRPPLPNVVSSAPLLRRRTTQNEPAVDPPPATTIRPLGCTSTACAVSVPPNVTAFLPLPSKLVSRSPAATAQKSSSSLL